MIAETRIGMSDSNYKLNSVERETIITFNETQEPAEVFTYNPAMIRRLDELHEAGEAVEIVRAESVNGISLREYRVPKKWVSVRRPRRYSDEQKAAMGARLHNVISKG